MGRFDPQLLAPITHRSAEMQNDLAVVRARGVLVRARTQCVNAVRGLVKTAGGRLPDMQHRKLCAQGSRAGSEWLRKCACADVEDDRGASPSRFALMIASSTSWRHGIPLHGGAASGHWRRCACTAVTYALTLGDPSRFKGSAETSGRIWAWCPVSTTRAITFHSSPSQKPATHYFAGCWFSSARLLILGVHGPDWRPAAVRRAVDDTRRKEYWARSGHSLRLRANLPSCCTRLWANGELYNPLYSERENRQAA